MITKSINQKKASQIYSCIAFDRSFLDKHEDCEKYVALQSSAIHAIFNWTDGDDATSYEGIVSIRSVENKKGCHRVYRKAIGHASPGFNSDSAMLGYRTRKQLGIELGDQVEIKKACWIPYLWFHPDSTVSGAIKVAVFWGVVSIVLSILSLFI